MTVALKEYHHSHHSWSSSCDHVLCVWWESVSSLPGAGVDSRHTVLVCVREKFMGCFCVCVQVRAGWYPLCVQSSPSSWWWLSWLQGWCAAERTEWTTTPPKGNLYPRASRAALPTSATSQLTKCRVDRKVHSAPDKLNPMFQEPSAKDRPQISQPTFMESTATQACAPLMVTVTPSRVAPQVHRPQITGEALTESMRTAVTNQLFGFIPAAKENVFSVVDLTTWAGEL